MLEANFLNEAKQILTKPERQKKIMKNDQANNITERYPIRRGLIGYLSYVFGMTVTRLMIKLRAEGRENIPDNIPYVIAANHETYVDGMWIGAYLPKGHFKHMSCISAKELEDQHGLLGRVIVKVGRGIAIDRFGNPIRGLILAKKKVDEGNILLVHPEGTRSIDGRLGEIKDGAAYIAVKSKVPLVPVFIDGGYEVFSRHMKKPRSRNPETGKRHEVVIRFGRPMNPSDYKNARDMTDALRSWMAQAYATKRVPRTLVNDPAVKD